MTAQRRAGRADAKSAPLRERRDSYDILLQVTKSTGLYCVVVGKKARHGKEGRTINTADRTSVTEIGCQQVLRCDQRAGKAAVQVHRRRYILH